MMASFEKANFNKVHKEFTKFLDNRSNERYLSVNQITALFRIFESNEMLKFS